MGRRYLLITLMFLVGVPAAAQDRGYEIGPGDVLQVAVLGQPTMSGEMPVDTTGFLNFPFLGKVKAAGMSAPELERKLTTLLSEGYLKRPQVAVTVRQYKSQRVFVTGEVAKPGPYGLRPDRSLLALIQDVGDFTNQIGHEVLVIRPPSPAPASETQDGEPPPPARPGPALPGEVPGSEIFRVNLRELRAGYPGKDMGLQPGDTVYFPKAAQIYVTGHVARPGSFRFEEGLTVFQVLALAGSVTERGSEKGVRIIRLVDGKRKEIRPKLSDVVLPEDTVHVPERFF
jgi:polysaccharide biosynthesis/export protein